MKINLYLVLKIVVLLLLPVSLASAVFFYYQSRSMARVKGANIQKEIADTVTAVSKLIQLPADTVPTVATVTDKSKLQSQDFFKHAENGDKVLIYKEAKKAILYRPSIDKIIDVAPVKSLDSQPSKQTAPVQNTSTASGTITPSSDLLPLSVSMYDGTESNGVTYRVEQRLKLKVPVEVVARQEAAQKDYLKTLVVSISGKQQKEAQQIAVALGAEVVPTLPAGELIPPTDLLIIIGADRK